jgi:hypothetical protein
LRFRPPTPHIKLSGTGRAPSFPHPLFATTISSRHANLASRFSISHLLPSPGYASARSFATSDRFCSSRGSGPLANDPARRRVWSLPLNVIRTLNTLGGISEARMAPKQATLGYVKSGQTTLGWVITKEEPFLVITFRRGLRYS